jgi:SsrA-binding protein
MAAKKKDEGRFTEIRNAKVLRDYFVDERFEAGIRLTGTEVKAVRAGRAQISDSFARPDRGELWLMNAHIDPYEFGNRNNHDARRARKLLLHKHQIKKIIEAMQAGGRSLVPLRFYFKEALMKVELGLCTGKKNYDKREDLKKKVQVREISKELKARRS